MKEYDVFLPLEYNDGSPVEPEKLPDYVGKDLAKKIMDQGGGTFRGLDLKVGGEGMKGFYDQILPAAANKLGKKYGARVEEGRLTEKDPSIDNRSPAHAAALGVTPVHSIRITPELKRAALGQGFPTFTVGGDVHMPSRMPQGGKVDGARRIARQSAFDAALK